MLLLIKLTIAGGMLEGLIYFANLSTISLHTSLLGDKPYTAPMKTLMANINLNLGYLVCFYNV